MTNPDPTADLDAFLSYADKRLTDLTVRTAANEGAIAVLQDASVTVSDAVKTLAGKQAALDARIAKLEGGAVVTPPTTPPPVTGPPSRDTLAANYGKYLANHPDVVGLPANLDYHDFANIYPTGTNTYVSLTTGGVTEKAIIWGEARMQAKDLAKYKTVVFAGRDPKTYGIVNADGTFNGNLSGVIKCYGTGYYQFEIEDSLIDPGLWMDPAAKRPGGAAPTPLDLFRMHLSASAGVHGGRGTLRRVEIRNVQDGFQFVQAKTAPDDPSFTLIEGSWLHRNVYYNGPKWVNTTDGSHSDGVQTAVGSNLTVRGSYLGGKRDLTGYASVPAYNSGDDAWNTEFMLQQQRSITALDKIENVLIEKNAFEGGTYGINHYYDTRYPNLFETTAVRDNLFVRRADRKYVIRSAQFAQRYSNNRVIDVAANGRDFTVAEEIPYAGG